MENGAIPQKRELSQAELSRSLAIKAEMETRTMGKVEEIRCPKCGEHPVVEITPHRLGVRCPCGFVRNGEIYD